MSRRDRHRKRFAALGVVESYRVRLPAGPAARMRSVSTAAGTFWTVVRGSLAAAGLVGCFSAASAAAATVPTFQAVPLPGRIELPRLTALADVSGDGIRDLVVGSQSGLFVMFGDADGGFRQWRRANADDWRVSGSVAADFDEDGCPDVVAGGGDGPLGSSGSGVMRVYRCTGQGGYERIYERRANILWPVAGDFDGDGHADIAAGRGEWYLDPNLGGQYHGVVEVQLGDGKGGFSEPIRTVYGDPDTSVSLRYVADLNEDGRTDLLSSRRAVLLGDGSGGFGAPMRLAEPEMPGDARRDATLYMGDVAAGDIDENGHVDLVVRWSYQAKASGSTYGRSREFTTLYFGDGTGHFSGPVTLEEPLERRRTVVDQILVDLDRDGHLDVVLTTSNSYDYESELNYVGNSQPTEVYRGHGDGTFDSEPVVSPFSGGTFVSDFLFKRFLGDLDLDGDGNRDLLVTTGATVRVVPGDGTGGLAQARDYGNDNLGSGVVSGDFDGNGTSDVAVANYTTNSISVWLGDGKGGLSGPVNYPVGDREGPAALTTGDVDGDGHLDLVSASPGDLIHSYDPGLSVLRGDGNGAFGAALSFPFWAPTDVAVADFDGDGTVDLAAVDGRQRVVWLVLDPLGRAEIIGYLDPTDRYDNQWNSYFFTYAGMSVGDWDHNGWPDVARTSTSGVADVFFNVGNDALQRLARVDIGYDTRAATAADVDGDGNSDLLMAGVSSKVSVLRGDGTGGFTGPSTRSLPASTIADNVSAGDLDGGGVPAVVVSFGDHTFVQYADAAGDLGEPTDIGRGIINPRRIAWGDVDGDGLVDLVHPFQVFFNRGACGDGRADGTEECDDGNTDDCDGCSASCRREIGFACGDGIVSDVCGEQCDDGDANADAPDVCRSDCQLPRCGDGIMDAVEDCDDGNTSSCDGCSPSCTFDPAPVCGDGYTNRGCGESCDDGNTSPRDGCSDDCRLELIAGGGSARKDCLLEWKVVNPANTPFYDKRGSVSGRQSCQDGDPECDFDDRPGFCGFRVALCASVNDPNLQQRCYPVTVDTIEVRKPSLRDAGRAVELASARSAVERAAAETVGASFDSCSQWVDVPVATRSTSRPGRLRIKAVGYGAGRMKDGDKLRLECRP